MFIEDEQKPSVLSSRCRILKGCFAADGAPNSWRRLISLYGCHTHRLKNKDVFKKTGECLPASQLIALSRPGGYGGVAAPVPIPNTAVKRPSANGTSS